jgi:tol-pal system protein YbgF
MNARLAAARALIAVALAGAAGVGHAGVFDDDLARQRIDQLRNQLQLIQKAVDGRLGGLEAQVQDRSAVIGLATSIDGIRDDMARLRGQIEVLVNRIEQGERRQKDFYADLDSRLRKLELARDDAAAKARAAEEKAKEDRAAKERADQENAAAEGKAYEGALSAYKAGDYKGSVQQFQAFLAGWPDSPLNASAQYWIGNALFALKDYKGSIAAHRKLVTEAPDNARTPDAMLNIASAQAELGETRAEQATLKDLVARFPKTQAADQAKQRLARRPAAR